jgi:hypothetical protein
LELIVSRGVDLIAGRGENGSTSLASRRQQAQDHLLHGRLAVIAEADSGVYISQRTCCDDLRALAAVAAAAVKIFSALKTSTAKWQSWLNRRRASFGCFPV